MELELWDFGGGVVFSFFFFLNEELMYNVLILWFRLCSHKWKESLIEM